MGNCKTHDGHDHSHGNDCGHTAVKHGDHTDYLHDGHLHRDHGGHYDECKLEAGGANPAQCTPSHDCDSHDAKHVHGKACGHESVPHGDHLDYLVSGHLHHHHGDHCDDHGPLR